jgi:hypothetical protein
MSKGPQIHKRLLPVASVFLGVTALMHALNLVSNDPVAHWYNTLSLRGQGLWDDAIISIGIVCLLIALASLLERLIWRLKRNKDIDDLPLNR